VELRQALTMARDGRWCPSPPRRRWIASPWWWAKRPGPAARRLRLAYAEADAGARGGDAPGGRWGKAPRTSSFSAGQDAGTVRRTLIAVNDRVSLGGARDHADRLLLRVMPTQVPCTWVVRRLELGELGATGAAARQRASGCSSSMPAGRACLTRVKGGTAPFPPFDLRPRRSARGGRGRGVPHLQRRIRGQPGVRRDQGQLFTHRRWSRASSGAADANGDGRVHAGRGLIATPTKATLRASQPHVLPASSIRPSIYGAAGDGRLWWLTTLEANRAEPRLGRISRGADLAALPGHPGRAGRGGGWRPGIERAGSAWRARALLSSGGPRSRTCCWKERSKRPPAGSLGVDEAGPRIAPRYARLVRKGGERPATVASVEALGARCAARWWTRPAHAREPPVGVAFAPALR